MDVKSRRNCGATVSISLSLLRPLKIGRCQDQKFRLKRKPVRESASSKPVAISSNKHKKTENERKKIYVIFSFSLSTFYLNVCYLRSTPLQRQTPLVVTCTRYFRIGRLKNKQLLSFFFSSFFILSENENKNDLATTSIGTV